MGTLALEEVARREVGQGRLALAAAGVLPPVGAGLRPLTPRILRRAAGRGRVSVRPSSPMASIAASTSISPRGAEVHGERLLAEVRERRAPGSRRASGTPRSRRPPGRRRCTVIDVVGSGACARRPTAVRSHATPAESWSRDRLPRRGLRRSDSTLAPPSREVHGCRPSGQRLRGWYRPGKGVLSGSS
jgi:hypothetical protein